MSVDDYDDDFEEDAIDNDEKLNDNDIKNSFRQLMISTKDQVESKRNSLLEKTRSQAPIRRPVRSRSAHSSNRKNASFSNERYHDIQRENRRLLGEILKKKTSIPTAWMNKPKKPTIIREDPMFTINRRNEKLRIENDNLNLLFKLNNVKPSSSVVQPRLSRNGSIPALNF